jgi:hypothetical protein
MPRYKNHSISGLNHDIHEPTTVINLKAKRRHSLGNGQMDRLMTSNRNQIAVKPKVHTWLTHSPIPNCPDFVTDEEEDSNDSFLQVLDSLSPQIPPKYLPGADFDYFSETLFSR